MYRAEDPRARHMRDGVQQLSQEMGQPHWHEILQALVDAINDNAQRIAALEDTAPSSSVAGSTYYFVDTEVGVAGRPTITGRQPT